MTTRASVVLLLLFLAACDSTGPENIIPTPDALQATALLGEIKIYWRDVSELETRYEVEWSKDAVAWSKLKDLPANSTSVNHIVEWGTTYYYRVRACRNNECSNWAQTSGAWKGGVAPSANAPRIFQVSTNYVSIGANALHGGLPTFFNTYVFAGDKPVWVSPQQQITPATGDPGLEGGGGASFLVYGLAEDTEYQVFTIAKNSAGQVTSEAVSFKTSRVGPPRVTVAGLFLGPIFNSIRNNWSVLFNVTVDPGGMPTEVFDDVALADSPFSTGTRTLTFRLTSNVISRVGGNAINLIAGNTYKWRLIAINDAGMVTTDSVVFRVP
ncbi:MAG TPA: hypothetical protein VM100_04240 [Longimicrobiales bacterium]|nr:hypothetical protein [Longimicrobiales bacterium]